MKAIFFDIDGTIYHPEIGISQNTIDEIHRVQKLGHKCFIASGRPTGFISKEVKSIGFDGFVLANGAHIVTEGKTIDSLTLPYEETKKLIEYVESQGYEYILLTTDRCYLKKESPHMYEFYAWCNIDMDSLCNDYDLDEVLKKTIKLEIRYNKKEDSVGLIERLGAFFYEKHDDSLNIEVSNIKKLITNKTKAILPVHLYGRPCQMEEICKLANEYNLKIVEDCAQAFGAEYHGQKVGSFGDLAAFSFYPTKNLGGIGDSGMIATNDINLYNYCKLARSYGGDKYHYDVEGINSRMDEIQALFLLNKLNDIEKNNNKKIRNAKLYFKYLKNESLILPSQPEINSKNVFHIFCVRTKNRDKLKQYLEDNNIQSIIHYPIPIFKQKALKHVVNNVYPISEEISETVLSIPCSMAHTKDEIMRVIKVLNEYKE